VPIQVHLQAWCRHRLCRKTLRWGP